MFPDSITTERLDLQRCCRDNVPVREFYRAASHHNDHIEEVTEHLSWRPHASMKVSRDTLALFEAEWEDGEVATYAIRPRDGEDGAGELAGTCGLTCEWERDCATLGLWLRKRFWGRGYSAERADALFELAFDGLDLGVVAVTHHAGNENSERAIRKYVEANGGRREGLLRHHTESPDGPVDEVRYTVSQDEWATADGR